MTVAPIPQPGPDPVEVIRGHLADIAAVLDDFTTAVPRLSAADLPLIRQALDDARGSRSAHPDGCPWCSFGRKCAIYRRNARLAEAYARLLHSLGGPPGHDLQFRA